MKIFCCIFTIMALFLLFEQSIAFENLTEGYEYKFKYDYKEISLKQVYLQKKIFSTDVTIKGFRDDWFECQFDNLLGIDSDYEKEMTQKFLVQLDDKGKVIESIHYYEQNSNDISLNKEQIIEQITMNRNDIIDFIKEGYEYKDIEAPNGKKCEAIMTEETIKDTKIFKAKTIVPKCDVEDEFLEEFGDPVGTSSTEINLYFDTETNKQTELHLRSNIQLTNGTAIYLVNAKIEIHYLGSELLDKRESKYYYTVD